MQLFPQQNNEDKIYVDKNHKIQWIWTNVKGTMVKSILQEKKLPLKPLFIAFLAGLTAGALLALI
ncbi:Uncharacterized [Syntrophomonas zehnderi OL-4]|uniref:Uncharacterized n=1 Tax=Syntrophomonas zehnderi OL-4 TaxID=690567 RepID=A0A0E4GDN6_9FIRM|nr:hypothetical protein [Syntrophomonas zehnderi]CFX53217.1 Uncharacterized [Syntrophomonas zehnderi OL-4]